MTDEIFVEEFPDDENTDNLSEEIINEEYNEDKEDDDITSKVNLVLRKRQNNISDYSIDAEKKIEKTDTIDLPSDFDKEVRESLENSPNVNIADNDESRLWAESLSNGLDLNTYNEVFVPSLEDDENIFRQKNEFNGTNLEAKSPKFKTVENQKLKGERAVIRFISHLGLGTLYQVPLWHSGIWVTLKPPTESEIIELNRLLMNDKIEFGRYTYGLAFSNILSFTVSRLVDFTISHIYDTTVKSEDINVSNIKDYISCQDIPILLWGLVCTMYPKGFNYRRACSSTPDKCNYILESTINVCKLQWTNTEPLTEWQKSFMAIRQSKQKTLDEVKRYKDELVKIQPTKIYINKDLSNEIIFTLKTPTITEYINSGYEWINNIVDTVNRTLGTDKDDEKRNNIITKYGQATAMRQYSHWVESIEYDTNIVDDEETINKTLDLISSDDDIREEFIKGVIDYINKTIISVIGIPKFNCPECGTEQTSDDTNDNFVDILPIDVIQLFFGLLTQRLERIINR